MKQKNTEGNYSRKLYPMWYRICKIRDWKYTAMSWLLAARSNHGCFVVAIIKHLTEYFSVMTVMKICFLLNSLKVSKKTKTKFLLFAYFFLSCPVVLFSSMQHLVICPLPIFHGPGDETKVLCCDTEVRQNSMREIGEDTTAGESTIANMNPTPYIYSIWSTIDNNHIEMSSGIPKVIKQ